jgi:hypothetical protein
MWQEILVPMLAGLIFGSLVGSFNHWLVWSALKKVEASNSPIAKNNKILGRYLIRLFVDFLAMATFLLHRDVYALLGTALGLTLIGKVLSIKYSLIKRR